MRIFKDKINSADDLYKVSYYIRSNFQADSLRLRASFIWITENIAYDIKAAIRDDARAGQISYAIKNKKTICGGFAALVKFFCDAFNIECEIVEGFGRTGKNSILINKKEIRTNHAWNAVKINETWRLLDATWSSGSSDEFDVKNPSFYKEFNETYYFTPPEKLVLNHLPSNEKYQFLVKKVNKNSFKNSPLFLSDFLAIDITAVFPENALITAKIGDTIIFKFKSENSIDYMFAFSEKLEDAFYQGKVHFKEGWFEFHYPVSVPGTYNLYIGYLENGYKKRTLVGYKLEVKKDRI